MKGAIADPCVRTIRAPKTIKTITTGSNQYFFLILKKRNNCLIKDSILKLIFH